MAVNVADLGKLQQFYTSNREAFLQAMEQFSGGKELGVRTLAQNAGVSEEAAQEAAELILQLGTDQVFNMGGKNFKKLTGDPYSVSDSVWGEGLKQPESSSTGPSEEALKALGQKLKELIGEQEIEAAVAKAMIGFGYADFARLHRKVMETRQNLANIKDTKSPNYTKLESELAMIERGYAMRINALKTKAMRALQTN